VRNSASFRAARRAGYVTAMCVVSAGFGNVALTTPDWDITGDLTVNLRAERSGTWGGRLYTIAVECEDTAGNTASKTTTVFVPHDKR